MALGKICEYKGPLPGPVKQNDIYHSSQKDPNLMAKPSPTPSSISLPSPLSDLSRRSSNYSQEFSPGYDVDIVPGLAYFARAAEILGTLIGGQDLMHVQAFLLASLYASQMACVLEAWTWIQNACRACHFLIRECVSKPPKHEILANLVPQSYFTQRK
jgi:hypothetical protein